MNPKISVIVPVYKAEKYLNRCVDSILAQTFTDFEVLLIDDGSPDRSGEICDEYAKKDVRIHVYHQQNCGAGAAREFGVNKASGTWIMFVDSDDTIPGDSLENLLLKDNGEYDIISGIYHNLHNNTYFIHKRDGVLTNTEYVSALLNGQTIDGPCAKIIKKTLFHSYHMVTPKEIRQNEDMLMLIIISKVAKKVLMCNDVVSYNYIYNPNSARTSLMPLVQWLTLFNYIEKHLTSFGEDLSISYSFVKYRIHRLQWCRKAGMVTPIKFREIKKLYDESLLFSSDDEIREERIILKYLIIQYIGILYRNFKKVLKQKIKKIIYRQ